MNTSADRTHTKGSAAIFVVIGVVVLLAVGATVYFDIFSSDVSSTSAGSVMESIEKLETVTYNFSAESQFIAQDSPSNPLNFVTGGGMGAMMGGFSGSGEEGPSQPATSTYQLKIDTGGSARFGSSDGGGGYWEGAGVGAGQAGFTTFSLKAAQGATSSLEDVVSFEGRNLGDTYYVNVSEFPPVPLISSFVQPFLRRWVAIDTSDLGQEASSTLSSVTESEAAREGSELLEVLKSNQSQLLADAQAADIFTLTDTRQAEVGGKTSNRYTFSVDNAALKTYLLDSARLVLDELGARATSTSPAEDSLSGFGDTEPTVDEQISEFEETLESLTVESVTVGVMAKTNFPELLSAQLTYTTSIDDPANQILSSESVPLTLEMSLSGHNQPIEVQRPEDATDFKKIMGRIQGGNSAVQSSLGNARSSARDSRRQSDLQQIRTANELYKNENGRYVSDLSELEQGGMMQSVPQDPLNEGRDYLYSAATDGSGYCLATCLEDSEVPENNVSQCHAKTSDDPVSYAFTERCDLNTVIYALGEIN